MTHIVDEFIRWAVRKEPSLIATDTPTPINQEEVAIVEPKVDRDTEEALSLAYKDAYEKVNSLFRYMSSYNYKMLVFNYALHIAIIDATAEIDSIDLTNPDNNNLLPLQNLYLKYKVYTNTAGIITSSSSGGSSASSVLPSRISQGDIETSWLLLTPYGRQAELYMEQMESILV